LAGALRLALGHGQTRILALAALLLAATGALAQNGVFITLQSVGASIAQNVTVTAQVAGTVDSVHVLTFGATNLDFSDNPAGSNCAMMTLTVGGPSGACTESVTFTPAYPGLRMGAVVLLDGSGKVLATQFISGTGLGGLGILVPGNVITVAGVYRTWTSMKNGIPATSANLDQPASVTFDGAGNMYIADSAHNQIRKVTAPVPPSFTGTISMFAGTGNSGNSGDGFQASKSELNRPSGVALDGAGNLYIADTGNNVVRMVAAATGIITTVAGPGSPGNLGDNGPATSAYLNSPWGVTVDASGNLYIADTFNQRIRRVDAATGTIATVAGNGNPSGLEDGKGTYSGDGQQATLAGLSLPHAVAFDASGNMYIPDSANNVIRMVIPAGIISTFAGHFPGTAGLSGDGGPAAAATLNTPSGVAVDPAGNVYILDTQNTRIRKVNSTTNSIVSIAENGWNAISPSGTYGSELIYAPIGLFLDGNGDLYFADYYYMLIEKLQSNEAVLAFTKTPIQVGAKSLPQTQTVENDGNASLDLTAFTPDSNAAVDDGTTTCSLPLPTLLASDTSCQIGVVFAPSATAVFPSGATSEQLDGNVDVYGNTVNFAGNTENFPLDIVLVGTATPVNATQLALTSQPNPSTFGQSVTFTATVTAGKGAGTPAGTITFTDGTNTLASAVALNASGVATYTTSALTVGQHTITASFTSAATSNYLPSSSTSPLVQIVNEVTTTTLATSGTPSVLGASVTFTATVAISGGGGVTPDGTVIFTDTTTGTILGTPTLGASGIVTVATTVLTQETDSITAVYGGDQTNYILGSTSNTLSQVVQAATTTTVTSSSNPSIYGTAVAFTATVTPNGTVPASGTVSFFDGATQIGTGTLAGATNQTAFTTSSLAVASHAITAAYQGDTNNSPSTSAAITQVVNQVQTSTTEAAAVNPGISGKADSITATVNVSQGVAAPTGNVTFADGTTSLGSATLNAAGTATINPTLAPGNHTIVATYLGDTDDASSVSPALALPVDQAITTTTVTSSSNPALVLAPIMFTATVAGNGGIPTGSVTFSSDGTSIGTGTLGATGTATFTTSTLPVGSHSITATYAGDANDLTNTSLPLTQVLGTIPTVTDLGQSATTASNPQLILVVAVLGGSGPTPTGIVTFTSGSTTVGTATLDSSGVATLTPQNLATGTYTIIATYSGDTLYSPSTSQPVNISTTSNGFNLTVTPNSVTMATTQSATVIVALTPANGFTDTIGLGCASLPTGVTCHFASPSVALKSDSTQSVQLTIDTNNELSGGTSAMNSHTGNSSEYLAGFLLPFSIFFGWNFWRFRKRYATILGTVLILVLCSAALLVAGCGGFSSSSSAPGTYTIQVTATGAGSDIIHYQNVTLNITK
jgi:sugar lactone lactonase YvrE